MKRTTVNLPDDIDARLRHEAERRGITISELTREAIEQHLGGRGSCVLPEPGAVDRMTSQSESRRSSALRFLDNTSVVRPLHVGAFELLP